MGIGRKLRQPAGQTFLHAGTTPPPGAYAMDGAIVSRITDARLFAVIGTTYGAGDGVTTFQLPDARDEFPRYAGPGRDVGSKQGQDIQAHTHGVTGRQDEDVDTDGLAGGGAGATSFIQTAAEGGEETRPRNIAWLGCIWR